MLTPFAYPLTGPVQKGGPVARKTEHFPIARTRTLRPTQRYQQHIFHTSPADNNIKQATQFNSNRHKLSIEKCRKDYPQPLNRYIT